MSVYRGGVGSSSVGKSIVRIIRELDVRDGKNSRKIQICVGDLLSVPAKFEKTDLLGVSAFDGDYEETETSLIGSLGREGVHVGLLKRNQPVSLITGNSWISQPLVNVPAGIAYKRIICTETPSGKTPRHAVGLFLTGLQAFLVKNPDLKSISVPILGAGDQGDSREGAFKNLIKEAAAYLRSGLRMNPFRVVVRPSREASVVRWLDELRVEEPDICEAYERSPEFDAFLSYCRRDSDVIDSFHKRLCELKLSVFMDRSTLEPGDVWPERLHVAIARSRVFVPFVSSSFNSSLHCKQEADHAERLNGSGSPSLFPIRIENVEPVPPLAKRHAATLEARKNIFSRPATVETLCDEIKRRANAD